MHGWALGKIVPTDCFSSGAGDRAHAQVMRTKMVYRISYDQISVIKAGHYESSMRTEYFQTEQEALGRARELLDGGEHHAIELFDDKGNVLAGVRLQLKLGASIID
jgi:hypothetical protein